MSRMKTRPRCFHEILFFVIAILLFGWLFISSLVFIWWFWDTDSRDCFSKRHENIVAAVFIGSFLSLGIILGLGLEDILVFIPAHWGGLDEGGDFVTTRHSLAFTLGGFLSVFFACVFGRVDKMRKENLQLSINAEIDKRMYALRNRDYQFLIEMKDKTQTKLKNLRKRSYNEELSSEEIKESQILIGFLDKLVWRISENQPLDFDLDLLDEE